MNMNVCIIMNDFVKYHRVYNVADGECSQDAAPATKTCTALFRTPAMRRRTVVMNISWFVRVVSLCSMHTL